MRLPISEESQSKAQRPLVRSLPKNFGLTRPSQTEPPEKGLASLADFGQLDQI